MALGTAASRRLPFPHHKGEDRRLAGVAPCCPRFSGCQPTHPRPVGRKGRQGKGGCFLPLSACLSMWPCLQPSSPILPFLPLAQVWDDRSLHNADFSVFCPMFTLAEINHLERKFLELIDHDVSVNASL